MQLPDFIVAVALGMLLTLILEVIGIVWWFYQRKDVPVGREVRESSYIRPHSPLMLEEVYQREEPITESCDWMNVVADFLFQELRDSPEIKQFVLKQVNKEFAELLLTKAEGMMIDRLALREYSFGTSLPQFTDIQVVKVERDEDSPQKQVALVELEGSINYQGGFCLAIDADLVLNTAAYVSVQVEQVKGRGRLMFCRSPYTHWSVSFLEDPLLKMSVTSRFEGRTLPHLSDFIETILKKWLRRKHTLPNYKVRFKPFFRKFKAQDQLLDVHMCNHLLTEGMLKVEVIECNRLALVDLAVEVYCTVEISSTPEVMQISPWRSRWPVHEFIINRNYPHQALGIYYHHYPVGEESKHDLIVIHELITSSPAAIAGIEKGDVMWKVDNVKLTSISQAKKIIERISGTRVLLTIQRPPFDILKLLDQQKQQSKLKHQGDSTMDSGKGSKHDPLPLQVHHLHSQHHSQPQESESNSEINAVVNELDLLVGCGGGLRHRTHAKDSDTTNLEGEGTQSSQGQRPNMDHSPVLVVEPSVNEHRPLASNAVGIDNTSHTLEGSDHIHHQQISSDVFMDVHLPTKSVVSSSKNPSQRPMQQSHLPHAVKRKSKTTKSLAVCMNPQWEENFKFLLGPEDHYLNICVWSRLQHGAGDLMIGHITLSLADLALECAATSGGQHQQRYTLVAAQLSKTGASKAALKITSGPELPSTAKVNSSIKSKKFAGDILLRFIHTTQVKFNDRNRNQRKVKESLRAENGVDENLNGNPNPVTSFDTARITSQGVTIPDGTHQFVRVDMKRSEKKCTICQKRIWKYVLQCKYCQHTCHKKCAQYCSKFMNCKRIKVDDDPEEMSQLPYKDEQWEDLEGSSTGNKTLEYSESRQLSIDGAKEVAGCKSTQDEREGEDDHLKLPPISSIQNADQIKSESWSETLSKAAFAPLQEEDQCNGFEIVTPPCSQPASSAESEPEDDFDEVNSEQEIELKQQQQIEIMSKDIPDVELEIKINDAQHHITILETDKRTLEGRLCEVNDPDNRDDLREKLSHVEAKLEATLLLLHRYKEALRLQCNLQPITQTV